MTTINEISLAALEQVIKETEADPSKVKRVKRWKESGSWRKLWPRLDKA